MWPLKTILYFLLFWGACIASLVNPIWGVVNYMLAYQSNPPITWWGQPLVNIGMRFSMLAISFTIAGLFLSRQRVPHIRPVFSLWEVCVFGLLGVALLDIGFGIGYDIVAQTAFEKFWKLQVFVLILTRLATTRRNLELVIWSIVAGSLYLGHDAFTAPPSAFLKGRLEVFGGPDIATSSGAAAHLTAMLPIIGVAFLTARHWVFKAFAALSGAFTINAVILCRTRSAFVGLLCGAAAAVLMAPRAKRFRIHLLLLIGGVAAFSLTDTHYWERMSTLADQKALDADQATVSRADIWKASLRILADYPMGVGLGNFARVIGIYDPRYPNRSPHNTLVMGFTELGIPGGILFVAIVLESIRLIYVSSRLARQSARPLETTLFAYGFVISLVTYFVAGLGTERFSCESFWWVLAFPLCLHRVVLGEVRAEAEQQAPEPLLLSRPEYGLSPDWAHAY
ncbi:MAG: O-antigen ligase family protein [Planctomycetes bacterium]|nr:O-antigen ligase family protein [Planctomycetota bacterium]